MALRDLAPEARGKARDGLTADIRARIADALTPEQKPKFAALVTEAASRTSTRGRIYLMEEGKPKAFNVRLGITDGTSTELIVSASSADAKALTEGAGVIIGVQSQGTAKTGAPKAAAPTPRLGF
jgi:HlyD family secretion protein